MVLDFTTRLAVKTLLGKLYRSLKDVSDGESAYAFSREICNQFKTKDWLTACFISENESEKFVNINLPSGSDRISITLQEDTCRIQLPFDGFSEMASICSDLIFKEKLTGYFQFNSMYALSYRAGLLLGAMNGLGKEIIDMSIDGELHDLPLPWRGV